MPQQKGLEPSNRILKILRMIITSTQKLELPFHVINVHSDQIVDVWGIKGVKHNLIATLTTENVINKWVYMARTYFENVSIGPTS